MKIETLILVCLFLIVVSSRKGRPGVGVKGLLFVYFIYFDFYFQYFLCLLKIAFTVKCEILLWLKKKTSGSINVSSINQKYPGCDIVL